MTRAPEPFETSSSPQADDPLQSGEEAGPIVGRETSGLNPMLTVGGFAVAAILLFLALNARRTEHIQAAILGDSKVQANAWTPPPPLALPATQISAPGPSPFSGLPVEAGMPPAAAAPPPASSATAGVGAADAASRLHAPALVVDLGRGPHDMVLAQASPGPALGSPAAAQNGASPTAAGEGQRSQLTDSEQFAKRIGEEQPENARAAPMGDLSAIAPQGTIIPGVLETAINSDVPGFTRAVVSRDVLSFDGKAVLIPRGSHLIGQYKSAVAIGQSRAFIIWTRVIRPDGVSIQIGSPGTDELGRGGLEGKVDRHFFRRFSGSILLSVLNAAVASVGRTPSTQISIGSPGAATGWANSALQGDAIPPTIRVAQGEAINIFVARDLDFSGVEPVR